MNNRWQIGIAFLWLALQAAHAVETATSPDFQTIRASLLPIVQETLAKNCGAYCPGFSILPQYKTAGGSSSVDDLGFEGPQAEAKELKGITIEVLTQKDVEAAQQETIKATVAASVRNHADLPVQVRTKLTSPAVLTDYKLPEEIGPRDWLYFAKDGLWPIVILALGLLALFGLLYTIRSRRRAVAQATESLEASSESAQDTAAEAIEVPSMAAESMLADRNDDLGWYLQDRSEHADYASLRRLLKLFPGDTLSKKLTLSPLATASLAKALSQPGIEDASSDGQRLSWLRKELDTVHWKRLSSQTEPVSQVADLSTAQVTSLFNRVDGAEERALILTQVEGDKWPNLLSAVSPAVRIETGVGLYRLQQSGGTASENARKKVIDGVSEVKRMSRMDGMLNDFVYCLSEEEATAVSNQIASGTFKPRKSVEEIVLELNEHQLLELVLQLDIDGIRTLAHHMPEHAQARILKALPKKLRERVGDLAIDSPQASDKTEAEWVRTRSRLFKIYSALSTGKMQ